MSKENSERYLFVYLHELFEVDASLCAHLCAAVAPAHNLAVPLWIDFMQQGTLSSAREGRMAFFALAHPVSREGFGAVRDFPYLSDSLGIPAPYYFSKTMLPLPEMETYGRSAIDPLGIASPPDPEAERLHERSDDPYDPSYMQTTEDSLSDGIIRARMNCVVAARLAGRIAGIDETRIHPSMPNIVRLKTLQRLFDEAAEQNIAAETRMTTPSGICIRTRRHAPRDGGPEFVTLRCEGGGGSVASAETLIAAARDTLFPEP